MQTVREIVTKWVFQGDDKKVEAAEAKFEKFKHSLEHGAEGATKLTEGLEGIKHRLEFLTTIELAKIFGEWAEKFAHFAEDLHVGAEAAGLTVERFQELSFAAGRAGVSQEEMGHSLSHLSRKLYEAQKGGSEAILAFTRLGIPPDKLMSIRSSEDALAAVADASSAIQNPIERTALLTETLGRSSVRMTEFLKGGSKGIREMGDEARKSGNILDEHQIKTLVATEHALRLFWETLKNIGATIAVQVSPLIQAVTKELTGFLNANRALISINVEQWLEGLAYDLGFMVGLLETVTQRVILFAKAHHFDKDILKAAVAIMSFVSALIVLGTTMHYAKIIADGLTTAFSAFSIVMKLLSAPVNIAVLSIRFLQGALAQLALSLAAATESEALFGVALAIANAPIWLVVLAIGALVLAGHELYALFTGNETWIASVWKWAKPFEHVRNAIDAIKHAWNEMIKGISGWLENTFQGVLGKMFSGPVGEFLMKHLLVKEEPRKEAGPEKGAPGKPLGPMVKPAEPNPQPSALETVQSLFGDGTSAAAAALPLALPNAATPAPIPSQNTTVNGGTNYEISAPVTINVPPGTDPAQAGVKVKEGIKEYMDRLLRETHRSTKGAVAH